MSTADIPYNGTLGQFRVSRVCGEPVSPGRVLDSPQAVYDLWQDEIATAPWFDPAKEHAVVFVMDVRMRVTSWNVVCVGTLSETLFHPREVLRPVIVAAGCGFIVAHNHPSGDPSPSRNDEAAARRLGEAAKLLQLDCHDNLVVGEDRYHSFRESGVL